ncbi:MAG TPA: cupin domain-containing protein [Rhodanobacteraceae bacterium]|jgi:quercetin dioxygenase-like cupin family protein|nr:cupin domain-containing protein [Rhodanobacteraceae bacterium]
MKMKWQLIAVLAFACGLVTGVAGADPPAAMPDHVALGPTDVQWMPAPPVLPKGVQIAVLSGNPSAEGFSTVRLKIPPHTTFAPHWHPTAESFSVLRGTFYLGMGDEVDKARARALPPMGFASLPAQHHHWAYSGDEEVVIDLGFYGPFQIHYVNPPDDPSKAAGSL